MNTHREAQRAYDNHSDDCSDADAALSEAVSVRVAKMHKDPEWIEKALNQVDCDYTEDMMCRRVMAHMADDREVYEALAFYERCRVTEYLLKFAKAEIYGEREDRCARTADMFANRLSNDEE